MVADENREKTGFCNFAEKIESTKRIIMPENQDTQEQTNRKSPYNSRDYFPHISSIMPILKSV
eukprot:m.161906 g.161906  ORF g.161906 m.161906 type:complete len:63 (+) comp38823_c0_seq3:190-378(+)